MKNNDHAHAPQSNTSRADIGGPAWGEYLFLAIIGLTLGVAILLAGAENDNSCPEVPQIIEVSE